MPKRFHHDLHNRPFGDLTAIEYLGNGRWKCICKCSKEVVGRSHLLRQGKHKSCQSCANKNKRMGREAAINKVFAEYKDRAKRRGLEWKLTRDQFIEITSSPCHYTGLPPSLVRNLPHGSYIYNGIDRMDNTKGYLYANCVPCCSKVNQMKMDSSLDELFQYCRMVLEYAERQARKAG
jgi:hypothetical protein